MKIGKYEIGDWERGDQYLYRQVIEYDSNTSLMKNIYMAYKYIIVLVLPDLNTVYFSHLTIHCIMHLK